MCSLFGEINFKIYLCETVLKEKGFFLGLKSPSLKYLSSDESRVCDFWRKSSRKSFKDMTLVGNNSIVSPSNLMLKHMEGFLSCELPSLNKN